MLSHSSNSDIFDKIVSDILKEGVKELTKTDARNEINKKLKFLGIDGVTVSDKNLTDTFTVVKKIKIDPKLTGPISPVFKSIELEIRTAYGENYYTKENIAAIALEYSWQHPRGSNGYTIKYTYTDGKWER